MTTKSSLAILLKVNTSVIILVPDFIPRALSLTGKEKTDIPSFIRIELKRLKSGLI